MIRRVLMLIVCLLLVSACDAGGNPSGVIVDSTSGESYVPIDLNAVTDATTGMIITGAIDHNTGEVDAFQLPADRGQTSYRNIEVETRNGYLARFTYRTGIDAGTYPIDTTLNTIPEDGTFAGGLLYLWSPDPAEQFTINPEGTMTITFDNEIVLGTFTFSAQNPDGETVTIEGQFYTRETESVVRS